MEKKKYVLGDIQADSVYKDQGAAKMLRRGKAKEPARAPTGASAGGTSESPWLPPGSSVVLLVLTPGSRPPKIHSSVRQLTLICAYHIPEHRENLGLLCTSALPSPLETQHDPVHVASLSFPA